MSNTDGEDMQKVSLGELLLNAGTRIVDLEKQSNDQVEIITHLDQELASLREQLKYISDRLEETKDELKQKEETIISHKAIIDKYANEETETITSLRDLLKQKEDENRELLDSISQLIYAMNTTGLPWNTDSTAEKAYANCRSLLKKHIG